MVRAYLRHKHALPTGGGSGAGQHMRGGYVDIFATGVVGPIVYADVESLYPSIMLNYDVTPENGRPRPVPGAAAAPHRPAPGRQAAYAGGHPA